MKKKGIVILKFGGTSMNNAETMSNCMEIIKERIKEKKKPFVVVSAISKMTDTLLNLLNLAKNKKQQELYSIFPLVVARHFEILNSLTNNLDLIEKYTSILNSKFSSLFEILNDIILTNNYDDKTQANILSYGEDLSSDLMELCLIKNNINCKKIHSKYFVKTKDNYLSANVDFVKTKMAFKKILNDIENDIVFIMTGFFGGDLNNDIMLLGRGGSDFSGSIAGISLEADAVEIWTDADGVMSADPRLINNAKSWETMNKDIASEMARAGAKILHPKTILASYHNIDIIIRNLFNQNFKGTLINSKHYGDGVKGIVSDDDYSILHLENQDMFGETGFIANIGFIASENHISLDMTTTSETSISFTIKTNFLNINALNLFNSIANFNVIDDVAKISIIGENIASNNILENIFKSLKNVNIEPLMVSMGQSKNNIGIIVNKIDKNNALSILHNTLFKHKK